MFDLIAAMADVRAKLAAAGPAPVYDDERSAVAPCLMLRPPIVRPRFGKHCADVEWSLYAMAPATGRRDALATLGPLISQAMSALPVVSAEPADIVDAGGGAPLPGYVLTWTGKINETESTP